jgi:hypothetical protein
MPEENTQGPGLDTPGRSQPSGTKASVTPRSSVNKEQRKLRLVITAFNIAKVAAVLALFLLIAGMI